jgi:polygalacturonase
MIASRRSFLQFTGASIATGIASRSFADDRPAVTDPRATDGDSRFEPKWDEKLTVTVGQQNADLVGRDDKVLQAAIDYVSGKGGGTVKVLPGTYTLRAAVELRSGIQLVGSGAESIITRIPSETIPIAADSDWYDQTTASKTAAVNRGSRSISRERRRTFGLPATKSSNLASRCSELVFGSVKPPSESSWKTIASRG